jgi:hypothetical protein
MTDTIDEKIVSIRISDHYYDASNKRLTLPPLLFSKLSRLNENNPSIIILLRKIQFIVSIHDKVKSEFEVEKVGLSLYGFDSNDSYFAYLIN